MQLLIPLVHRRITPKIKFAGTHLYNWVERDTVRAKCLAQLCNTMSPAMARPSYERQNATLQWPAIHMRLRESCDQTRSTRLWLNKIGFNPFNTAFWLSIWQGSCGLLMIGFKGSCEILWYPVCIYSQAYEGKHKVILRVLFFLGILEMCFVFEETRKTQVQRCLVQWLGVAREVTGSGNA